jgi:ATP-binding cassette, subfamily B, bacterial
MSKKSQTSPQKKPSVFALLTPYKRTIAGLVAFAVIMNLLTLVIPKLISRAIDAFIAGNFALNTTVATFIGVTTIICILTYVQGVLQTIASEKVARDLRNNVAQKISEQNLVFIQKITPATLLTNLTSDIESVKLFISQAIVSLVSSLITVIGSAILLMSINWKLALAVLTVLPIIGIAFSITLAKVRVLFKESQGVIDWLNRVINESIHGSALIRILNAQTQEYDKFVAANSKAKDIGMSILRLFAGLIPLISFVASIAVLMILVLGGKFVINGDMTLGDFTAFNSYVALMIFPIIVIGFMSNVIARATASYERILEVTETVVHKNEGTLTSPISGNIRLENVQLMYGERAALNHVSLSIKPKTKNAIIGPTAAGKTQLLYTLTGLLRPDSGKILFDEKPMEAYNSAWLHAQIGFVFQDSAMFNLSIQENIAFSPDVTNETLKKAIETSELQDFIATLPEGLNTIVSERGVSLSGGQKQRILLARALALNPKILLLDDFTARVDANTEKRIISNIAKNYPDITLLSVTQKITSIENFDQIILLMEGEILATGTHPELLATSPEYVQIFNSQQSTQAYELSA